MNKPFNLEDFKNGQKALTREGLVVTFVGIRTDGRAVYEHPDGCLLSVTGKGFWWKNELPSINDLVSMVSRHQHLIDSYDLEDTWQEGVIRHGNLESNTFIVWLSISEPNWDEHREYRLHLHNNLIKAWNKGAKIEAYIVGDWVEEPNPDWYEDTQYQIKIEPKTKTVYEWIHEANVGNVNYFVSSWVADEDVEYFFGLDAPKQKYKTGRRWEVEA